MPPKTKDYNSQAKKLNREQRDRILSRMTGKLPKRLAKDKVSENKAIAIQLALEDEQLQEWKVKVTTMRAKEKKKNK